MNSVVSLAKKVPAELYRLLRFVVGVYTWEFYKSFPSICGVAWVAFAYLGFKAIDISVYEDYEAPRVSQLEVSKGRIENLKYTRRGAYEKLDLSECQSECVFYVDLWVEKFEEILDRRGEAVVVKWDPKLRIGNRPVLLSMWAGGEELVRYDVATMFVRDYVGQVEGWYRAFQIGLLIIIVLPWFCYGIQSGT